MAELRDGTPTPMPRAQLVKSFSRVFADEGERQLEWNTIEPTISLDLAGGDAVGFDDGLALEPLQWNQNDEALRRAVLSGRKAELHRNLSSEALGGLSVRGLTPGPAPTLSIDTPLPDGMSLLYEEVAAEQAAARQAAQQYSLDGMWGEPSIPEGNFPSASAQADFGPYTGPGLANGVHAALAPGFRRSNILTRAVSDAAQRSARRARSCWRRGRAAGSPIRESRTTMRMRARTSRRSSRRRRLRGCRRLRGSRRRRGSRAALLRRRGQPTRGRRTRSTRLGGACRAKPQRWTRGRRTSSIRHGAGWADRTRRQSRRGHGPDAARGIRSGLATAVRHCLPCPCFSCALLTEAGVGIQRAKCGKGRRSASSSRIRTSRSPSPGRNRSSPTSATW